MLKMRLELVLGLTCARCGEYFTTETLAERRAFVALFGMTAEVCPLCYSTPDDREGGPLPPPPPLAPYREHDDEEDVI